MILWLFNRVLPRGGFQSYCPWSCLPVISIDYPLIILLSLVIYNYIYTYYTYIYINMCAQQDYTPIRSRFPSYFHCIIPGAAKPPCPVALSWWLARCSPTISRYISFRLRRMEQLTSSNQIEMGDIKKMGFEVDLAAKHLWFESIGFDWGYIDRRIMRAK